MFESPICNECYCKELDFKAVSFQPLVWQKEEKIKKVNTITDYSINEVCPHNITYLKVIESVVTCETTVEVCEDCGKILTEPKIDCG